MKPIWTTFGCKEAHEPTFPIKYVSSRGAGGKNDGTSWKDAYTSLARYWECEGHGKVPLVDCDHTETLTPNPKLRV